MAFQAIRLDRTDAGRTAALATLDDADLGPGDVTVRVTHSTLNYKDALAILGRAPIVRRFPMTPGIDFAGVVEASDHPDVAVGDAVVLNGRGVGEDHPGGLAGRARVKGEWLTPMPAAFTAAQAMAIGTAGYTAMLCVMALERHGLTPERGPVVVTGAAGGVGSVAIALLAKLGWRVVASTGRLAETGYLTDLGAAEVIDRAELTSPGRPLGKERFAAGVDSVGSHTLANLLSQTLYGGAVAACGLAQGMDLPASVAPFILRAVALLGVDSVNVARPLRIEAWSRLARDLDLAKLASMTTSIPLDRAIDAADDLLAGRVRGRLVVETGG